MSIQGTEDIYLEKLLVKEDIPLPLTWNSKRRDPRRPGEKWRSERVWRVGPPIDKEFEVTLAGQEGAGKECRERRTARKRVGMN